MDDMTATQGESWNESHDTSKSARWYSSPVCWYLIFTVTFYSHRLLFGWWAPDTALPDSDEAPTAVKLAKDCVWVAFLAMLLVAKRRELPHLGAQVRRHRAMVTALVGFSLWMAICGGLRLLTESPQYALLYWIRYPLEYLPVVVCAPLLIRNRRELAQAGGVWFGLIYLTLAFLMYEMLSGAQTGFTYGGIANRYGSIFGAPNDFGMYCAISLIGLAALWAYVPGGPVLKVITGGGLLFGLLASVSRSAGVCLVIGMLALFLMRVNRRQIAIAVVLLAGVGAICASVVSEVPVLAYAAERIGGDDSAQTRIVQWENTRNDMYDWGPAGIFVGSPKWIHNENYYAAVLTRSGFAGLGLYCAVVCMTLRKGWRNWRRGVAADNLRHSLDAMYLAVFGAVSVVSLFIPCPDMFPTNFYYWSAAALIWGPRL